MPRLENTRHEYFCQQESHIHARVAELQEEGARDTAYTLRALHRPELVEGLREIMEANPAEIDENNTLCQYFKRTKDGITCRFPGKLRALGLALKLQGLLCKTPGKKPADAPGHSTAFTLPKSLLFAIQEKRKAVLELEKTTPQATHQAILQFPPREKPPSPSATP